ncbi:hypothetical protein [Cognatishimia sp. WU-CL00825]|uniref:hypothetical protein n=1 Tax=Cognatishimia sp. WU-CL00825 TaxID=3127658 RepID=UPI0033659640
MCAECGGKLTACWSRGKRKKYPYYLCKTQGCMSCRKSVRRGIVHNQIEELLKELVPRPEGLRAFKSFVDFALKRRLQNHDQNKRALDNEIQELHVRRRRLLDKIVDEDDEDITNALKERLKQVEADRILKEQIRLKSEQNGKRSSERFEHCYMISSSPCNIWKNVSLSVRGAILRACFKSPPQYLIKRGFRTPELL